MIQTYSDSSKRVAYFYNRLIGKFHYGKEHPMKPKRIAMAHNLIVNYGQKLFKLNKFIPINGCIPNKGSIIIRNKKVS